MSEEPTLLKTVIMTTAPPGTYIYDEHKLDLKIVNLSPTWIQCEIGLAGHSYQTFRFNTSPEHLRQLAAKIFVGADKYEEFYKD